jgi:hypothetical protein
MCDDRHQNLSLCHKVGMLLVARAQTNRFYGCLVRPNPAVVADLISMGLVEVVSPESAPRLSSAGRVWIRRERHERKIREAVRRLGG